MLYHVISQSLLGLSSVFIDAFLDQCDGNIVSLLLKSFLDVFAVFSVINRTKVALFSLRVHIPLKSPYFVLSKQFYEQFSLSSRKEHHSFVIVCERYFFIGENRTSTVVTQEVGRFP